MQYDFEKAIPHLSKDKVLQKAIDAIVLPEREHTEDVYLGLIKSIVSQQLSVKAAETIYSRFINLFEEGYPHAPFLLSLEDAQLRGVGLSGQKTSYVKNVASYFSQYDLFKKDWSLNTNEEIITQLTEIKGVGRWTVQMILMFVLSRQDILPVLDLGIQHGIKELYGVTSEKKELFKDMERIAEPWRPYRSVACLYLWAYKDMP